MPKSATVTLDGSDSNDPDGSNSSLTYAWTQTDGATVQLINATNVAPSFDIPENLMANNSSLTFRLIVTDEQGPRLH